MRTAAHHCEARQHSDQMVCGRCSLAWDVNDIDPPTCPITGQGGRASGGPSLAEHKSFIERRREPRETALYDEQVAHKVTETGKRALAQALDKLRAAGAQYENMPANPGSKKKE